MSIHHTSLIVWPSELTCTYTMQFYTFEHIYLLSTSTNTNYNQHHHIVLGYIPSTHFLFLSICLRRIWKHSTHSACSLFYISRILCVWSSRWSYTMPWITTLFRRRRSTLRQYLVDLPDGTERSFDLEVSLYSFDNINIPCWSCCSPSAKNYYWSFIRSIIAQYECAQSISWNVLYNLSYSGKSRCKYYIECMNVCWCGQLNI